MSAERIVADSIGQHLRKLNSLVRNDFTPPALPTAVIFVHGYLAAVPEAYWLGSAKLMYDLRRRGIELHVVRAPMTGPVADRAQRTATALDKVSAERVVLVGHSMGGLDARFAALHADPARRVSDVITLGTPHHGTMIADFFHKLSPRLPRALRNLDDGGLENLTRAAARRFNDAVPDRPDVRYASICGRVAPETVPPVFRAFARKLQNHEGDNDSLVSVASATWGETSVIDDADHWALIGLEWISAADLRHRIARLGGKRRPLAALRRRLQTILTAPPRAHRS